MLLTEFLGIGEIKEVLSQFFKGNGYQEYIAWYPMGAPIKDLVVMRQACTMMIGK